MLLGLTLHVQGFDGVVPDVISFNVGIAAFMANSMDKKAFELLDEMERRGIRPRADTFNSILTGMTKVGTFLFCHTNTNRPSTIVFLVDKGGADCHKSTTPVLLALR